MKVITSKKQFIKGKKYLFIEEGERMLGECIGYNKEEQRYEFKSRIRDLNNAEKESIIYVIKPIEVIYEITDSEYLSEIL
jgi:hypothetical protein